MATRVEDQIWSAEGAQKRAAVRRMFADIAPTYDLFNRIMSVSLDRRWRAHAVATLDLKPGDRALDVCCGTGDFLTPLMAKVGPTGVAVGVDFCPPMLEVAARKLQTGRLSTGDACQLPIASAQFEAVTVGWGIRNVPDVDRAHLEIARVLKPGGRFASIDMARPRNILVRTVSEFVMNSVLPLMGSVIGKSKAYTYLPKSIQTFRSREQLEASMASAGMVDIGHRDLFFGNICIHFGRRPESPAEVPPANLGEPKP